MTRLDLSRRPPVQFGLGAILAILLAIGSLIASFTGHWGWGLALAVLSLPLGTMGLLRAPSPRLRGAMASVVAVGLGAIGLIVSLMVMLARMPTPSQ